MARYTNKETPREVAVHEAGHAVASVVVTRKLGHSHPGFDRVFIRTPAQSRRRYVNKDGIDCGRVFGMVEGSALYSPRGRPIYDIRAYNRGRLMGVRAHKKFINGQRAYMEAAVIVDLAGPLAEARSGDPDMVEMDPDIAFLYGGETDLENAREKASDFCRKPDEIEFIIQDLCGRAFALIVQPGNWIAINAVADRLMAERSLDAEQVVEVIEAAWAGAVAEQPLKMAS